MADGESGTKAEHAEPGAPTPPEQTHQEHPPEMTASEKTAPESGTPAEMQPPKSVWTASDARGPLVAADTEAMPTDAMAAAAPDQAARSETPHDPVPGESVAASTPAHATEPKAKRSAMPIAAGLVVGAIIGAASALAFYTYETQSGGSDPGQKIAALSSRVDALQARPPADPETAPLKASVTDLGGKVASLQQQVAALQASSKGAPPPSQGSSPAPSQGTGPASGPAPSQASGPAPSQGTSQASGPAPSQGSTQAPPSPSAFDPAPLQQRIAALQTGLDALREQTGALPALDGKVTALATATAALQTQTAAIAGIDGQVADLKTGLGNADKQAAATQSDVAKLQAGQKTLEGKVTSSPALAVVADSLVEQIDHGAPYAGHVAALTSLGADPAKVAVLKQNADKGVPSAKALAAAFEPLVDPMVATEHRVAPNAGFMERMKSGMAGMISIRRVGDTSGDDLGSRVARIQADLTHDDVAAAFATWDGLPADAKAKSEAWGALAKTHADAMAAAHALQSEAINALGAKKS